MKAQKKAFVPGKLSLTTILLASMLILMGAAAVAPALGVIQNAFPDASQFMVSLIITLPALGVAVTGFGMGSIADRIGMTKMLAISLALFAILGVSGFFIDSLELILVLRFFLGMGIAGISISTTALISMYYTGVTRMKVISYQSAAMGVGALVLESIGGGLAGFGWQEPFLIYLIAVPILLCGLISIRPYIRPDAPQTSADVAPVVIPNKKGIIASSYIAVFISMFMMFILPLNLARYAPMVDGITLDNASLICGVLLGLLGVSQGIVSVLYSRSTYRPSNTTVFTISFACIAIGFAFLSISNIYCIAIASILVGSGLGLLVPTAISSLAYCSQNGDSGKIMGGYSIAMNLGTFSSAIIITPMIEQMSYTETFTIMSVVTFVVAAVCLVALLITRSKKTTKPAAKKEPVSISEIENLTESTAYHNILVAIDGSDNSKLAVLNALRIAKYNDAKITGLYVFDPNSITGLGGGATSPADVDNYRNEMSTEAFNYILDKSKDSGIKVATSVMSGHPADVIVEQSHDFDLVICGSLGRTDLKRALMGSVAEKVARMASCPVLICRKMQ